MGLYTLKSANWINVITGEVHADTNIVVEGGVIASLGAEAHGTEIDLSGRWVTPGLIDAHVHTVWNGAPDPIRQTTTESDAYTAFRAAEAARKSLLTGVTTIRDVGGPAGIPIALAAAMREGILEGADVWAAGEAIVQTGGHVYPISYEADGPHEVRKGVRLQMKQGAQLIKLMASGGAYTEGESIYATQLTPEEIRVAVEEAHTAGLRVAVHALNSKAITNALAAGADTVEHGALADSEALELFVEKGAYLIPTLTPYYYMARFGEHMGVPSFAVEKSKEVMAHYVGTLREAFDRNVLIALGTDAGSPGTPHSCVAFESWIWHHEAGIPSLAILHAATAAAAAALGAPDRGRIEVGKVADLVAFKDNPLEDIRTLHEPVFVMKRGQPYSSLLPVWSRELIAG